MNENQTQTGPIQAGNVTVPYRTEDYVALATGAIGGIALGGLAGALVAHVMNHNDTQKSGARRGR